MRKSLIIALNSIGLLYAQQASTCSTPILSQDWSFFDDSQASPELKQEAIDLLKRLLHDVKYSRGEQQARALDTWQNNTLRNRLKLAIGIKDYRGELEKIYKSTRNDFALLELKKSNPKYNNEDTYNALASEQNPEFFTDTARDAAELSCFWQKFKLSFLDSEGATPQEKLLNIAIAKGWNHARIYKADVLFQSFDENGIESLKTEGFDLLRIVAQRGFVDAMYNFFLKSQKYSENDDLLKEEGHKWLEAAADLDSLNALYTSATFHLENNNFADMGHRIDAIFALADVSTEAKIYARSAETLRDLMFLRKRGLEESKIEGNLQIKRKFIKGNDFITQSMRDMAKFLRSMFEEIDMMQKEMNELSNTGSDDVGDNPTTDEADDARAAPTPLPDSDEETKDTAAAETKKTKNSLQTKRSKKKSKVATRKDNRKNADANVTNTTTTPVLAIVTFSDNPFALSLKKRLQSIRGLVHTLLMGNHLNGREIQDYLNAFPEVDVENTVGSHNKLAIKYTEESAAEKMTFVAPHVGKRRDLTGKYKTMSGKLRARLRALGINSVEDLD